MKTIIVSIVICWFVVGFASATLGDGAYYDHYGKRAPRWLRVLSVLGGPLCIVVGVLLAPIDSIKWMLRLVEADEEEESK